MSKIIGITVGTPMNPQKVVEKTELEERVEAIEKAKENGEFNGADGADGKSAYQYAKDGGYTGTEKEFAQKMAKELDVQINGESIVENGVANIPVAGDKGNGEIVREGLVVIPKDYGLAFQYNSNNLILANPNPSPTTEGYLEKRKTAWQSQYYAILVSNLDKAVRLAMCDGKGEEWTAEEKQAARERIGAVDSGIEITSGEPTKESTVITVDPNAEEVNLYTAEETVDVIKSILLGMKRWKSVVAWDGVSGQLGYVTCEGVVQPIYRVAWYEDLNHPSAIRITVNYGGQKEVITLLGNEMDKEGIPFEFDKSTVTAMQHLGLYVVPGNNQSYNGEQRLIFEYAGFYLVSPEVTGGVYVEKIELGY